MCGLSLLIGRLRGFHLWDAFAWVLVIESSRLYISFWASVHFWAHHAGHLVQFWLRITLTLALEGLSELQVEDWIFLALEKILIDFWASNLEHLDSID